MKWSPLYSPIAVWYIHVTYLHRREVLSGLKSSLCREESPLLSPEHPSPQRLPSGLPKSTASLLRMVSNLGSWKRLFHNGGKGNFSFRLASMRTNVVDTNLTYVGQEFHSQTGLYWLCHVAAWKKILNFRTPRILYSAERVLSPFPLLLAVLGMCLSQGRPSATAFILLSFW